MGQLLIVPQASKWEVLNLGSPTYNPYPLTTQPNPPPFRRLLLFFLITVGCFTARVKVAKSGNYIQLVVWKFPKGLLSMNGVLLHICQFCP